MPTKLKGPIGQLKAVVEMTGASGEWQDKGNGHWQFRANDGAILNWWQSSGTLNFQGPPQEKQEFEHIVQLAIAKLQSDAAMGSETKPAAHKPDLPPVAPLPTGRYRHYKGKEYEVLGVARHSETLEELVVYRALYGERGLWVRPRAMFVEQITIDGKPVPRFAYVGPK